MLEKRGKVLYGVQGTGNGHISRARVMAKELYREGYDVDFIFSGREGSKYFDMEIFGDYRVYEGLTMVVEGGRVRIGSTIRGNNIIRFMCDVKGLDIDGYDILISDYDPIVSWAGFLGGREVIGIGHQYAFNYEIPKMGNNVILDFVMKWFAPVSYGFGLHWDNFGDSRIMLPIIDIEEIDEITSRVEVEDDLVLVYLAFEDREEVLRVLGYFGDYRFCVYGYGEGESGYSNIKLCKSSREGFMEDVIRSGGGVICGAGFELVSELLYLGRRVMVKAVGGQMEQLSNALGLELLGYGRVLWDGLNREEIGRWLVSGRGVRVRYGNIGREIVRSIVENGGSGYGK